MKTAGGAVGPSHEELEKQFWPLGAYINFVGRLLGRLTVYAAEQSASASSIPSFRHFWCGVGW